MQRISSILTSLAKMQVFNAPKPGVLEVLCSYLRYSLKGTDELQRSGMNTLQECVGKVALALSWEGGTLKITIT